MTERISTGMRNAILAMKRALLDDFVIKIYTGTPPTSADNAVTGTLLVTVTKSGGTVDTTERSKPDRWIFTIGTGHVGGNTVAVNVTVDGVGPTTHTYIILASDTTDELVAEGVARMLNDIPQIEAICLGSLFAPRTIVLQSRVFGITLTIANGGGTYAISPTKIEAGSRSDALYFAKPSSGSMSKATDTWSGTIVTTGVAGYFRIVRPDDDGTLSTTQLRLQGAISTSGAELNMANTTLTATELHTISDYSITEPAE